MLFGITNLYQNIAIMISTKCVNDDKCPLNTDSMYFPVRSKAVVLLWIFYVFFCLVFAIHLYASVYMCLVVTCWERADLLALVCGV